MRNILDKTNMIIGIPNANVIFSMWGRYLGGTQHGVGSCGWQDQQVSTGDTESTAEVAESAHTVISLCPHSSPLQLLLILNPVIKNSTPQTTLLDLAIWDNTKCF